MIATSTAALRTVLECLMSGSIPGIDQPEYVAKLASAFPHSIVPAPSPFAPALPIASYNCFEYAFGVVGRREVCLIAGFLPSTFCDGAFAAYLVESTLVSLESAANGDLVLYHDGRQYTHAGLVHADRVLSKWGSGPVWLHGTLEVPVTYGSTISYYRVPSPEEIVSKFLEFARQREGAALINQILASDAAVQNADA